MRFILVSIVAAVLSLTTYNSAEAAITKSPPPLSGPNVVKQRWRVFAKMYWPSGQYYVVYITWHGLAESIDWSTAAVYSMPDFRFFSPFERARARFEITSKPVLDLEVPINGG